MTEKSIRQGNMAKLVYNLLENGDPVTTLASAVEIRLALVKYLTTTVALETTDASSLVTVDDPQTGSISWQLTSTQTDGLAVGQYTTCIQAQYAGGQFLEWKDVGGVSITRQCLENT